MFLNRLLVASSLLALTSALAGCADEAPPPSAERQALELNLNASNDTVAETRIIAWRGRTDASHAYVEAVGRTGNVIGTLDREGDGPLVATGPLSQEQLVAALRRDAETVRPAETHAIRTQMRDAAQCAYNTSMAFYYTLSGDQRSANQYFGWAEYDC